MIKMADEEINEIRRIRHEISARFGHDISKLVSHYQELEKELRKANEYEFIDTKQSDRKPVSTLYGEYAT